MKYNYWANASEIKASSIPKSSDNKARLHRIDEFTIFTSKTIIILTILSLLIVILFQITGTCTLESGMLRNFINGGYL